MNKKELKRLEKAVKQDLENSRTRAELKKIYKKYLGSKGQLSLFLEKINQASKEEKKELGRAFNEVKDVLNQEFEKRKKELAQKIEEQSSFFDYTLPPEKIRKGHLHPLTQVKREMVDIFQNMGFEVAQGPEVETDWYNFDALNIPQDHPARDMWDTFWLEEKEDERNLLLRTHTSPVQVRYMEQHQPPIRIISPGKVYRHEATDASHEFQLYHLEGLMIDKDVTVADFKGVVEQFFSRFFKKDTQIRLRPSFFPFTEPSFEIDIGCVICQGEGCSLCSQTGWVEMMGAGMVHPKVLENSGLDSREWQGFAFGLGIDRTAMIRYRIPEIRWFHSGDLRFLKQF